MNLLYHIESHPWKCLFIEILEKYCDAIMKLNNLFCKLWPWFLREVTDEVDVQKKMPKLKWLLKSLARSHQYLRVNKLCKILKEMGIPEHLTCLLRNLYTDEEATVRTGFETTDWFQIRKGVHRGCILSPCFFNLYAEYIMRNAGLEEAKLESRLPGETSRTSDMQMTPPLWQKVKRN